MSTVLSITGIAVTFEGGPAMHLRPFPVKDKATGLPTERFWYALSKRGKAQTYGVNTTPWQDRLPATVDLEGETLALEPGRTAKGAPKVHTTSTIEIDGEAFRVTLQVSNPSAGTWNILAKAHRPGGASNKVADLSELD